MGRDAAFDSCNISMFEPILNFVCRGHIMLTKGAMNAQATFDVLLAQAFQG